jgi:CDP-diacylglycerol--glycerol-3-phosphate 3-phosphatidyltransferase
MSEAGAAGAEAADSAATVSVWNVANALTAARILLVPIFGWLLLAGSGTSWRIGAALVFLLAVGTDRLDGQLARRYGWVTDLGKIADPIADKALIGMALVGLSLLGELPWWVTVVVAVRELGITVMRLVLARHTVLPAGHGGKLKTALQSVAIVGYLLPLPSSGHVLAVVVMVLAVLVTVVTGIDYVIKGVLAARAARRSE